MFKALIFVVLCCAFSLIANATTITETQVTYARDGHISRNVCQDPDTGELLCETVSYTISEYGSYIVHCSGNDLVHCPIECTYNPESIINEVDNTDICSYALCQIVSNNFTGSYNSNLLVGGITYYRNITWSATDTSNCNFTLTITKVTP